MSTALANAHAPAHATTIPETPAPEQPELYRLSVDQFERMIDLNILTRYDKVELIEGLLVEKMTKNFPHVNATAKTQKALSAAIPAGWSIAHEIPLVMATSEPEPDFMVIRGAFEDYPRKPEPPDVALLVEISDSSLAGDRARARLFAEAGIPAYWIVNLSDRKVEAYSEPSGKEYRSRKVYGPDDAVPLVIDGREVARLAVKDLLPPAEAAPQPDAPR